MNASLVLIKADGTQKEVPLRAGKVVVGRDTDAGLRIPVAGVSRQHAEFEVKGSDVILRDLGSRNGTFVNAEKITERALKAGDAVTFDEFVFIVRIDGKPAAIDASMRAKGLPKADPLEDSDFGLRSPTPKPVGKPAAKPAAGSGSPVPAGKKPASDPGDSSMDGFNFDDLLDDEKDMPKL